MGFVCRHCQAACEPYRFKDKPVVLRCRACRCDTWLTAGTVMERTRQPLKTWFWAAYRLTTNTGGMSAWIFQRQLGLTRYETAFQMLHKLRAGMVRPNQDSICPEEGDHVKADETLVGGRTRGEGRGVHPKLIVATAVEVRHRANTDTSRAKRRNGRYAGRVRMAVVTDRSAESLGGFIRNAVAPGAKIITDDWSGYCGLKSFGFDHSPVAERGDPQVVEELLPIIHTVFANLKSWLNGTHHGVSQKHLPAYLNELVFRFNRRFYPFQAFRFLLGIAGSSSAPTYSIFT